MPNFAELDIRNYQEQPVPTLTMAEIAPDLMPAMQHAGFHPLRPRELPSVREPFRAPLSEIIRVDEAMDGFLTEGEKKVAAQSGGWLYFQKEDPQTNISTITRVGYIPVRPENAYWTAMWGLQIDTMVDLGNYNNVLDATSASALAPSQDVLSTLSQVEPVRVTLVSRKDMHRDGRSPIYFPEGKLFYSNHLIVHEPYPFSDTDTAMETVSRVITYGSLVEEDFIKRGLAKILVDSEDPNIGLITTLLNDPNKDVLPQDTVLAVPVEQEAVGDTQAALHLKNRLQYGSAKRKIKGLTRAIRILERDSSVPIDERLHLSDRLQTLKVAVESYEALASAEDLPSLDLIKYLPQALIENRIALGITQRDLATRLSIAEQQVQRDEVTEYADVRFNRILKVVDILQPKQTTPNSSSEVQRVGPLAIKNEKQYFSAKKRLRSLQLATTEQTDSSETAEVVQKLSEDIAFYENLKSGQFTPIDLEPFKRIPALLIKHRIKKGLTQMDLAGVLGLFEQQIQRYESTDYAGASLRRIITVVDALQTYERSEAGSQNLRARLTQQKGERAKVLDPAAQERQDLISNTIISLRSTGTLTTAQLREELNRITGLNLSIPAVNIHIQQLLAEGKIERGKVGRPRA